MKIGKLGIAAVVALALAGCAETGIGPKEGVGTLLGAAAGGWAGSTIGHGKGRLVATAAGTFLGGLIGNQIGRSMDRTDRLYAVRSAGDALEREPDGGYAHWENPNTGN
ncbi:MAG TPA: glycine zipper 2TM domain-containing protein, partial [Dongiaceae bacterium]|nr:glycine zipper 2TM domain-containing protein [Dongiaceae bacterium]